MGFVLTNDWSVFIEEIRQGGVVCIQGIIGVCWGIGEKRGCFKVEFEKLEVDVADATE